MTWKTDLDVFQALLEGARDRLRSLRPADTSEALLVIHNLREVAVAASMGELIPILDSVSNELVQGRPDAVERSLKEIQEHLKLSKECRDTEHDDLERCFEVEAAGHLASIREHLGHLEVGLEGTDELEELSRAVHTLKGAAAMMERQETASAAHLLEDLFSEVNRGSRLLDARLLAKLNQAVDLLEALVERPDHSKEIEVALLVLLGEQGDIDLKRTTEIPLPAQGERRRRTSERRRDTTSYLRIPLPGIRRFEQLYDAARTTSTEVKSVLDRAGSVAAELRTLTELVLEHDLNECHRAASEARARVVEGIIAARSRLEWAIEDIERQASSLEGTVRHAREPIAELRSFRASWLFDQLVAVAEDVGHRAGRHLTIGRSGDNVLVERDSATWLLDQLQHVVRNAVAHGLEEPAQRIASAKEPSGRLLFEASAEAGRISFAVEDDGCGIDLESIRQRVVDMGLRTEEEVASADRDEALEWIFLSGVSSRTSADQVAGRGVGLDVVRAEIERRGGNVRVATWPGRGTRLEIQLPDAVERCAVLLVTVASVSFALPLSVVRHVSLTSNRPDGEDRLSLASLFELRHEPVFSPWTVSVENGRLEVDAIRGVDHIELHTLNGRLASIGPYLGVGTCSNSRSTEFVLDHDSLFDTSDDKLSVLLVEDSETVRTIFAQSLSAAGCRVLEAADGLEALESLRREIVDLVVTDLEMPRLDGIGLMERLREDPAFEALPVIVVTSNENAEIRARVMELSALAYVAKSRGDKALVRVVRDVVRKKTKPHGHKSR